MSLFYYDLHIHSCLSPCAEDEMTPGNIAGMGSLAGINVMALTDHNSSRNCPAFFVQCRNMGIVPIAGMELTTSEDIHVVCLFEKIEDALRFDKAVYEKLIKFKNREDVYGKQLIYNSDDEEIGEEEYLLSAATEISYDDAFSLVKEYGGIAFPAHIDREANGVVSTLGILPEAPFFSCTELYHLEKAEEYTARFPFLREKTLVTGSDAHFLTGIRDASAYFEAEAEGEDEIRKALFRFLKGETP